MTLQELRQTGKDGWYDPDTDQYYLVGEGPVVQEAIAPKAVVKTAAPVEVTEDKKTDALAADAKATKATDKEKVGK